MSDSVVHSMDINQEVIQLEEDLALQMDSRDEFSDHKEEPQPVDNLWSQICNSEDLLTDSQLVKLVAAPTRFLRDFRPWMQGSS